MKKVKFRLRNFLHIYLCTKINKKILDFVCVYACPQIELLNSFIRAQVELPNIICSENIKKNVHFLLNMRNLDDGPAHSFCFYLEMHSPAKRLITSEILCLESSEMTLQKCQCIIYKIL